MKAMNLLVHKGILHRIDYDINGDSKQYTINSKLLLSGTVGALITVLDACLINGFGSVTLDIEGMELR